MTTPILPPIPPTPTAASTGAEWDLYLRAVGEHNRAAHAEAQAATAVAMQASVAAQIQLAAAMAAPVPVRKPTLADLVIALAPHQSPAMTPSTLVTRCNDIAKAIQKLYPDAVEG